jgi:hypothetical protein
MSLVEAERIGDILGIDWNQMVVKHFRSCLEVELDNHAADSESSITSDDKLVCGKIVLAQLKDFPEHYTRLAMMEKETDEYWANV